MADPARDAKSSPSRPAYDRRAHSPLHLHTSARSERHKLQRQTRTERKGANRQLRKDGPGRATKRDLLPEAGKTPDQIKARFNADVPLPMIPPENIPPPMLPPDAPVPPPE